MCGLKSTVSFLKWFLSPAWKCWKTHCSHAPHKTLVQCFRGQMIVRTSPWFWSNFMGLQTVHQIHRTISVWRLRFGISYQMDYAGETSPVRKVIQLMPSWRACQDFHGMEAPQWNSMDGCFFSEVLVAQFMETSRNHETSYIVSSTAPNKLIRLVLVSSVEFMLSHNLCHSWPVTSCVALDIMAPMPGRIWFLRERRRCRTRRLVQKGSAGQLRSPLGIVVRRGKLLDSSDSSVSICTQ